MDRAAHYDFAVIGAGIAGICAALAAARAGLRTVLVNDRDVPGGNASSEHRVHICGSATKNASYYAREAGIADEIKQTVLHQNPRYNSKADFHLSDMALHDMLTGQPNLTYLPGVTVYDSVCEGERVTAVRAFDMKKQRPITLTADWFCDASGDGIVAYTAGCSYRVGREAKSEYGEQYAPDTADHRVMGNCILFTVKKEENAVEYHPPKSAYDLIRDDKLRYFDRPETGRRLPKSAGEYNGIWWLEYGGENDVLAESRDIDAELRKLVYGYWDYIKNSGKYPDAANYTIDWIAPYASRREGRRFVAPYTMTERDILRGSCTDAVATGGWSIDVHDVGGIYGNERTTAHGQVRAIYNIPFSIMYSAEKKNLFFAGRTVSASHAAFGSLRVMETLGAMGQAVGEAAALCHEYGVAPDEIAHKYMPELQDRLQQNGQLILHRREDCGIAESAHITASSTRAFACTKTDDFVELKRAAIFTLPSVAGQTDVLRVRLQNRSDKEQVLHYSLYDEEGELIYGRGRLLGTHTATLPPHFDGLLPLETVLSGVGGKIFVELAPCAEVFLGVRYGHTTGAPSFFDGFARAKNNGKPISFCFATEGKTAALYAPEMTVNGISRPLGAPNCWVSEGEEEWLEYAFDTPRRIRKICIYFNPEFQTEHFDGPIASLVTDFSVIIENGTERQVTEFHDNGLAQIALKVDATAERVRFCFHRTAGEDHIEVMAVKIFK